MIPVSTGFKFMEIGEKSLETIFTNVYKDKAWGTPDEGEFYSHGTTF